MSYYASTARAIIAAITARIVLSVGFARRLSATARRITGVIRIGAHPGLRTSHPSVWGNTPSIVVGIGIRRTAGIVGRPAFVPVVLRKERIVIAVRVIIIRIVIVGIIIVAISEITVSVAHSKTVAAITVGVIITVWIVSK